MTFLNKILDCLNKILDWLFGYNPSFYDVVRRYAISCHKRVNQKYDGKPYKVHLEMVYNYAVKYIKNLPVELQLIALISASCHDLIEDTGQTYNEVKTVCGIEIAEVVYALSNEKGKNRKERANDKYYNGIKNNLVANYVKICDRLANAKYSKDHNSKMFGAYVREYSEFKKQLYRTEFDLLFVELEEILK